MELILASASPRRRELLTTAGFEYTVEAADINESVFETDDPLNDVEQLAKAKATAIAVLHPSCVVLGADTVVVLDGKALGKPADKDDAAKMLRSLSGRIHHVYTGVCAVCNSKATSFVSKTEVEFYELTDEEIEAYIATNEPMDKAGSYGIQGIGCTLVKRINGDYFTVVGLPVAQTARLLTQLGVERKLRNF